MPQKYNLLIKGLLVGSALVGYKIALFNTIHKKLKEIKNNKGEK
jgi:hypothetical protein